MNYLLKSKIEQFVAKRVLMFFIILAILDIVFIDNRWIVFIGLVLGGIISVLRFSSYALVFSGIISSEFRNNQNNHTVRNSLILFIINQLVLLPLLFIAIKINLWFFTGVVAGMLLVPLVLFINCITEPLKITHNNFE
jgi:hypothetical protein